MTPFFDAIGFAGILLAVEKKVKKYITPFSDAIALAGTLLDWQWKFYNIFWKRMPCSTRERAWRVLFIDYVLVERFK